MKKNQSHLALPPDEFESSFGTDMDIKITHAVAHAVKG